MTPKVSVVVPVYNSEKYLRQCIESLIHQTLEDIELIFVDDGSLDGSISILEKYQEIDPRIQIYKQNNLYAGVARNNGMSHATGKYIIFLDSDDFFSLSMLEKLYITSERARSEITIFQYKIYDNITKSVTNEKTLSRYKGVFTAKEMGINIFKDSDVVVWNKFFLRSFITTSGLLFQNLKNHNDAYFTRLIINKATRITCCKETLLFYRVNNSSSLQGNPNKDLTCFVPAYLAVKKQLAEDNNYKDEIKIAFDMMISEILDIKFREGYELGKKDDKLYKCVKENLCPGLFDTINDFNMESVAYRVYDSQNYRDFLVLELQYQENAKNFQHLSIKIAIQYLLSRLEKFIKKPFAYSEYKKTLKEIHYIESLNTIGLKG